MSDRFDSILSGQDLNGDGVEEIVLRNFGGALLPPGHHVYSGVDGQFMQSAAIGFGPPLVINGVGFPGDTNGDGIAEISTFDGSAGQLEVFATSSYGAESYGTPTPSGSLTLSWVPNDDQPRIGAIEVNGALPNANLLIGVSIAPGSGATFGANHPLWISAAPENLVLTASVLADGSGTFRALESLANPAIAGISLFLQVAQTTQPDAVSMGLQLLYGP